MLSQEQWRQWLNRPFGSQSRTFAPLSQPLTPFLRFPEGFVVPIDHPDLKTIQDDIETFGIPGRDDLLFARPKAPLTS